MFTKEKREDPVPIGKIAVMFQTGPVHAMCQTDLMGYFTVNVDDPTNPVFDPDFDTLSASIKTALKVLTNTVDDSLVQDIMDQLKETREQDD